MINRVITFSVKNKFLVFALVAMACFWGAWSMMHLPLDATPDLSETQVIVLSRWDRSPDIVGHVAQVVNLELVALRKCVSSSGLVERPNQLDERFRFVRAVPLEEDKLCPLVCILHHIGTPGISECAVALLSGSEVRDDEADVVHTAKHASAGPGIAVAAPTRQ